jgi:hypothetical protein
LIEADSIRFERAKAAREKGDRSQDTTGYGFLYYDAVMMLDPKAGDNLLVDLVKTQQYEHVLSQRLPMWLRRDEPVHPNWMIYSSSLLGIIDLEKRLRDFQTSTTRGEKVGSESSGS